MNDEMIKKIQNGREYRRMMTLEVKELEGGEDDFHARGYATTFNQPYLLWEEEGLKVYEQVDRHAFDECDMSDVIMQYDHNGRVFARTSNNTLGLVPDEHGLAVDAYLGGTDIGRSLFGEIKGGYTNKMSFGFVVEADKIDETHEGETTIYQRTITKIKKLYDVSAVSLPANDSTEISARSLRDGVIAQKEAERLAMSEKRKAVEELKTRVLKALGEGK